MRVAITAIAAATAAISAVTIVLMAPTIGNALYYASANASNVHSAPAITAAPLMGSAGSAIPGTTCFAVPLASFAVLIACDVPDSALDSVLTATVIVAAAAIGVVAYYWLARRSHTIADLTTNVAAMRAAMASMGDKLRDAQLDIEMLKREQEDHSLVARANRNNAAACQRLIAALDRAILFWAERNTRPHAPQVARRAVLAPL